MILLQAEVRDTFKVPNIGVIGGCYVQEGIVKRNEQIRLVREGIVIHEGVSALLWLRLRDKYQDLKNTKEVTAL